VTVAPGTRFGPYQVVAPLGAGGMGEVYRARDTRLGREVAIKILPQRGPVSAEERARFRREAKTISSLNHPHICVLHDIGQEGDTDYLVMELVEGETLARRITKGPLPTGEVLRIGAQIADALDRAHRAGVVHRDLKPGNVMLTKSGAKLMDFGLAREFTPAGRDPEATVTHHGVDPEESITKQGMIVGTFQYMAPEQLEGRRADARSDIWALGCVLYEMATGKRAFEGSTPVSVISAIMRDEPRRMSELAPLTPQTLERLTRACLAKNPDDRIQTAHDARLQLEWLSVTTLETSGPSQARHRGREKAAIAIVGAIFLLAVVGSLGLWNSRSSVEQYSFQALTHKPMAIFKAAFAPDGTTVVFSAAMKGTTPQLYVIRPEYPEPQPIGDPGTHLLSVSSRGELAVLTHAEYFNFPGFTGTLARMPMGGGAPRELVSSVMEADWAPDGSALAIIRTGAGHVRLEFPIGRVLYQAKVGYLSDLRFSPRGDRIAFVENTSGRVGPGTGLKVVDLNGRCRELLRGHALTGVAWRPDAGAIYVSGMVDSLNDAVYIASLSGTVRMVLQSAGGLRVHDVASDGRWLATREDWRQSVMVHRPDWREDHDLSWLDASSDGRLSKDADLVVFTEASPTVGSQGGAVCVRKTSGSPVVRLCFGVNYWISPNGDWVLTLNLASPQTLALQPIGAGEPKPLSRGLIETYYGAWWFPDGDSILIMGQQPGRPFRLYVQDLVGGAPRALTDEGSLQPAIAPDGAWVLAKKGPTGYWRYRFDGTPPEHMRSLTSQDVLLPKAVDESSVLVGSRGVLPYRVQVVNLTNGHRRPFLEVSPADQTGLISCRITDFSGDFKSYAYEAGWTLSSLFLLGPMKRGAL
jgi:eukaryotic-like serine/threonine-protein kinase